MHAQFLLAFFLADAKLARHKIKFELRVQQHGHSKGKKVMLKKYEACICTTAHSNGCVIDSQQCAA